MLILLVCSALALARPKSHTVYPIYSYVAGEWVAGRDIYIEVPGYDYFRYSPTVAAFFVPWRLLGDAWGGAIWRACGIVLLAAGILAYSRDLWGKRESTQPLGLHFLLIVPFLLQNAHNGQSNPHILGMLLLGTACATTGRLWQSAAWFVPALLFKPYVLAVPALIILIERRLLIRLLVTLAIGMALPFLCQAPGYVVTQYVSWFQHLSVDERHAVVLRSAYRDVALLFRVYLVSPPQAVYRIATICVAGFLAFLTWRIAKTGQSRREQIGHAFILGSCWLTTWGPATESCTYLMLAPALVSMLTLEGARGRWVRLAYALFVGTTAMALFNYEWQIQVWGPQPAAGLIMFAVAVVEAARSLRRPVQNEACRLLAA